MLGLGDVYLGAPVAMPVDPRHRLVTTKYNPARTWTPENAVGIGGAYLCIYGMEGPGGYQFVGRTVPVWSRTGSAAHFSPRPWLLRHFDQIRWYPVAADELLDRRDDAAGRLELDITDGTFRLADHRAFLGRARDVDRGLPDRRGRRAYAEERAAWAAAASSHTAPSGSHPMCWPHDVGRLPHPALSSRRRCTEQWRVPATPRDASRRGPPSSRSKR